MLSSFASPAQATFLSIVTNQSVAIGGDGVPDVDVSGTFIGTESGSSNLNIATSGILPVGQSPTTGSVIDFTLQVLAFDDGGTPQVVYFSKISWASSGCGRQALFC